ncbi:uncharacterized protein LOC129702408 [Leucoraja erinacea]|uniref:uncharacterized protein LOC129702408 n=1 Tax=Leucoraja erinaceus TaxID=7782 RepID=UPI0024578B7C|nr:uncharacterized protein LOC129702408 [Leucoraja erinacea]
MARMKAVILSSCLLVVTLTLVSARPVQNARGLNSGSDEGYSRYFRSLYPSYYPYTPYFRRPYYRTFPGSNFPGINFPGINFPGYNFPGYNFPGSKYPGYGRVPIFNGFERNGNPGAAREEENLVDEGTPREYSIINVDSQSSDISREDTSSDEDDDYSVPYGNEVPDYLHPGVPDYAQPELPDYVYPRVPDYGLPRVPDSAQPRVPDSAHPRVPDYGHPRVPDYGHPRVPDSAQPRVPDYGHPRVPDYGHPRVPDYGLPRVPDYGLPRVPDSAHPRVPDSAHGHPRVPDYEEAVTQEEGFPGEPDYEGPFIPGMDTDIDVGFERQSSKGAEDGTSNAEDPTSVLPYSDSSQSTDSHGQNLEEDQIFTGSNQTAGLQEEVNGPAGEDSNPEQTLSNEGFVDLPRTVEDSAKEDQTAEDPRNTDLTTFTTEDDSRSEDLGRYEDQYRFTEDNHYEDDDLSDYYQEGNDETESEFSRAGSNRSSSSESDEMGLHAGDVEDTDDDEDSSEDVTNKSQAEGDWARGDEDMDANYSL